MNIEAQIDLEHMKAIVKAVYPYARLGRTKFNDQIYVGITAISSGQVVMLTDYIVLDDECEIGYEFAVWCNAAENIVGRA